MPDHPDQSQIGWWSLFLVKARRHSLGPDDR